MTRGQLPKAYLRIDPNIDQTHSDNLGDFIRLLCAANRQPRRGWFRSRAVVTALFGKAITTRFYGRGDVVDKPEGVWVPGWDVWQEGDLTVGDRVARFRANHALPAVTDAVTEPLPDRIPASEASRRLGITSPSGEGEGHAVTVNATGGDDQKSPFMEAVAYIEGRTRRIWGFTPGSKVWETLEPDVRDFGWPAVRKAMEAEKTPFPDVGQLVFGASRRLHPISGPDKPTEPDPQYVAEQIEKRRKERGHA